MLNAPELATLRRPLLLVQEGDESQLPVAFAFCIGPACPYGLEQSSQFLFFILLLVRSAEGDPDAPVSPLAACR
ncbi:unnamed protein product [Polarella glacialis]|uniref:Uncharacterized protein n=1 Tax=Polarella glacialis TaxID=89957 RepID=A0A813HIV5_POLGL|nr:unnamed protein product [Polarella glacialis]